MGIQADKIQDKRKAFSDVPKQRMGMASSASFTDNRAEAVAQRRLQALAHSSGQSKAMVQLQALADGNSTNLIQKLSKQKDVVFPGTGEPAIQRMIANVGKKDLAGMDDWTTLSTLAFALMEGGGEQEIAEWETADFSSIGKGERLYLLGHGSAGKVGSLSGDQIRLLAAKLKKELPEGYSGDIVSLSCHAGRAPKPDTESGLETLARALNIPGLALYGPMGKSYHHPALEEPRAFDPKKEKVDRGKYEEAKKRIGEEWAKKKAEISKMGLRERAMEAARISREFYHNWVNEFGINQWLLPKGWLKVWIEK